MKSLKFFLCCATADHDYIRRCSLLGKRLRLDYASIFDDYCRQLLQNQEHLTDVLLVNLIQVTKISIKVNDAFREMVEAIGDQPSPIVNSIVIKSFRNELNAFINQLPGYLKQNRMTLNLLKPIEIIPDQSRIDLLRIHCAAVRIRLYQPLRYEDKSWTFALSHTRCQAILNCLESTQELYDAFFLIPLESYSCLTFVPILYLALAIITTGRLLSVEDGAWDTETAQSICNFPGILQQLSSNFEAASSSGTPRSRLIVHGRPIFSEYAEAYRGIERWYLSKTKHGAHYAEPTLIETLVESSGVQYDGSEFWNQLHDLNHGYVF